jgi:hypothetical protein
MRTTTFLALAVGVALISTVSADGRTTQNTTPHTLPIVGAWTLNRDLSTAPDMATDPSVAGGNTRVSGPGGFGGRGGGLGRRSDEDRQRLAAIMRRLRDAPERLTITYADQTVAFADGSGRVWKVTTDGKKQTALTGDGEIESKARIEGARLIVEESISGRARLVYTYEPVEDAGIRRLSVHVKLEGGGPKRAPELKRVYDAVEGTGRPDGL